MALLCILMALPQVNGMAAWQENLDTRTGTNYHATSLQRLHLMVCCSVRSRKAQNHVTEGTFVGIVGI
jgi:hypothetical protein